MSIRSNLKPSLTKCQSKMLQYGTKKLTAVKEITFPFVDIHEHFKVVLNIPIGNRYVVEFKTKEDIGQILGPLGTDDYKGIS